VNEEEENLRALIKDFDTQLEATRSKIRRAEAKYRDLRYQRKQAVTKLRQLPYRTYIQRSGASDPIIVEITSMIENFQLWMDSFEGSLSPLRALSERSGVSVKTISDIMHGRRVWVTFDTADRLLSAIEAGWFIEDLPSKANKVGRPKRPESQYYEE